MSSQFTCDVCREIIKVNSSSILCTECNKWIHAKCTGLECKEFKNVALEVKKRRLKWKCTACISEVTVYVSNDMSEADCDESAAKTIEGIFEKYFVPFKNDIENSLADIRAELKKINKQNETITKQYSEVEKRVSVLEKTINNIDSRPAIPDNIIAEINNRRKREKNVVALNLPESTKTDGVERLRDDREQLAAALPQELTETLSTLKLRRLGRPSGSRPRPLLIETPSEAVAKSLWRANSNMSNIKFKPDLTLAQRDHLTALRNELSVSDQKDSKTIKYIDGIPRLVDKPKPHTRKRADRAPKN
ncbi:PREDICTED: uncharacterized protein LOC108376036 [Rhagoletis zephyria]|uniref:uncharacterized protein LOC108376036 n=1 Tax=Rhagoletis zephyria TaxID=28612 RepID=UPI0008117A40|nr:PREDICTED: uncharacterized protein LOC108376036 [Rhagoletis zephyria]